MTKKNANRRTTPAETQRLVDYAREMGLTGPLQLFDTSVSHGRLRATADDGKRRARISIPVGTDEDCAECSGTCEDCARMGVKRSSDVKDAIVFAIFLLAIAAVIYLASMGE